MVWVSLGWFWASNALPLDEPDGSPAHWKSTCRTCGSNPEVLTERAEGGGAGGGQRFPVTCENLPSLSCSFTINLREKQPTRNRDLGSWFNGVGVETMKLWRESEWSTSTNAVVWVRNGLKMEDKSVWTSGTIREKSHKANCVIMQWTLKYFNIQSLVTSSWQHVLRNNSQRIFFFFFTSSLGKIAWAGTHCLPAAPDTLEVLEVSV